MKSKVTILMVSMILLVPAFAKGQEKSSEEAKKIQMELEKKAQENERLKAEREKTYFQIKAREAATAEEVARAMEKARVAYGLQDNPDVWVVPGIRTEGGYLGLSQGISSLDYTRSLKESTITKEFPFEVEKLSKKTSISLSGSCEIGEIRIKIIMPNGKEYTEVLIDKYGSVNWNKTFTMDGEKDEKAGDWKFQIMTKEATGLLRIGIRTY
ncbi:MAG: hypothetical protein R2744_02825 [Bacteroidales bacterium]